MLCSRAKLKLIFSTAACEWACLSRDGNLSESEGEMDGPANEVTLPQKLTSRGNVEAGKSAIK